jgi:hypothetical protein
MTHSDIILVSGHYPTNVKFAEDTKKPLLNEIISPKNTQKMTPKTISPEKGKNSENKSTEKAKLSNTELASKKSSTELSSDKKINENTESDSKKSTPIKTVELYQESRETNGDELVSEDDIESGNEYDVELEDDLANKIQPKSEFSVIKEESPQKKSEDKKTSQCQIFD